MLDDRGFTLIEMLVAMVMTAVILSAVVLLFTSFINDNRYDGFREDAQSHAQTVIERMSRELRGATAPNTGAATIANAGSYDMTFQTVNATPGSAPSGNSTNEEWVRYCLDSNLTLWRQSTDPTSTTSTASTPPDTSACPSTSNSWVQTGSSPCCQVFNAVVNEIGGDTTRPLFTYGPTGWASTGTSAIKSVQIALITDANSGAGKLPGPSWLTSSVYLRNDLQAPTASITPSQQVLSPSNTAVTLNGTASSDPQGQVLSYQWYNALNCPSANAISGATSQTYNNDYNPNSTPSQDFSLLVTDSAGLTNCKSLTVNIA